MMLDQHRVSERRREHAPEHVRGLIQDRDVRNGWTTWDVVSETVTLLRYRGGFRAALTFLDDVRPRLHVVRYGDRVRDNAEQVFRRYGRDRRLSLCDAISFAVVTTLLRGMPCLAFDEDFRRLGLTVRG